jgi:benzoate-CoA ligase family protein
MIRGERFEFSLPEHLNLGSYFLDINLEEGRGNKTALYHKDKTYSFSDLWSLTNRMGNVFKELGVEPEDRVLLVLDDCPEWVAAWLATMKVGAVGTHAYTYLTVSDYVYLLDLIRPKIVMVDHTTVEIMRQATSKAAFSNVLLVAGEFANEIAEREFSLKDMLRGANEQLKVEPTHRDDIAYWSFSGGSTGKTKGVPHMHRDAVIGYESFNYMFHCSPDDIVLGVPKLFFHYRRDNGLLYPLRSGAAVVLFPERATPGLIFELAGKYKPTMLLNVPTMMRAMLQAPKKEWSDLSCLRCTLSSGEALSEQLYAEWVSAFGGEVANRVGSAEAGGYLTNRPGAVRPGSSGTVCPLVEIRLVDVEGADVPKGEPGSLLVRSDAAGQYYVRDHEKSIATFMGDEWVRTGDIFVQDAEDYFWYLGRADDAVKVSGVWVAPLEVEDALQACPSVRECAVVGIPDGDGLTKLKAFIVLQDEVRLSEDVPDRLRAFLREGLASYKIPRAIEFMDDLPKTGQGKIDRRQLRERSL